MPDDPNRIDRRSPPTAAKAGDAPEAILRRYLTDPRGGPGLGFYRDATAPAAAFRDTGRRLAANRNDPQVIADMVAIARHRGWTAIAVGGDAGFRREAWRAAALAGLEVRGYRPAERDRQDLQRRLERPPARPGPGAVAAALPPAAQARLAMVEQVVAAQIVEPHARARVLARAEARIRDWLERGGRLDRPEPAQRRDRQRG